MNYRNNSCRGNLGSAGREHLELLFCWILWINESMAFSQRYQLIIFTSKETHKKALVQMVPGYGR